MAVTQCAALSEVVAWSTPIIRWAMEVMSQKVGSAVQTAEHSHNMLGDGGYESKSRLRQYRPLSQDERDNRTTGKLDLHVNL